MVKFDFHEYANLFPMMTPQENSALVADMRENGYDKTAPIILYQGKILDGRNRYSAAQELGINAPFVNYDGDDPLGFVIRHNLTRRHLNETQRAGVAAKIANIERGEFSGNQSVSPNLEIPKISISKAAEMMNVGKSTVATYKAVAAAAPELIEKMNAGTMTAHEAHKKVKARQRASARAELAQAGASITQYDKWNVYLGDIRTWQAPRQYDFIVTDPPYPREFLPLWEVLAQRAKEWLKPGGLLIAMSGQSYLDEIYPMMSKHLNYWWTAVYLTPGGQSSQVFPRKAMPYWKPLLIYSNGEYSGKWFGDVAKSPTNNNEKDLHEWGQSVGGMEDIIRRFADSGQSILDPFCGSGTTGIAALNLGCYFDALEVDEEKANIAKGRLSSWM